jgi:cytosine/uracil/thiamine/allantoin permease
VAGWTVSSPVSPAFMTQSYRSEWLLLITRVRALCIAVWSALRIAAADHTSARATVTSVAGCLEWLLLVTLAINELFAIIELR